MNRKHQAQGYTQIPNLVIDEYLEEIGPSTFAVLVVMSRYADEKGRCRLSFTDLTKATGLSRQIISLAARTLEQHGLITSEKNPGYNTVYTLIEPTESKHKAIIIPSFSNSRRFNVLQRDSYRCRLCGASADDGARLEVDHIIPRASGGTNAMDNLWTLCKECNMGKRDKDL